MKIRLINLDNSGYGINSFPKTRNGRLVIWNQSLLNTLKDFELLKLANFDTNKNKKLQKPRNFETKKTKNKKTTNQELLLPLNIPTPTPASDHLLGGHEGA